MAEANTATNGNSQEIEVNADPNLENKEVTYRFKKDKLGNKRDNVKLVLPVPSPTGVVSILKAGGKQLDLLLEVIADEVRAVVGEWVGETADASQENFDATKFTWEAIANMPREDRRSISIPKETWAAFAENYIAVMPGLTKKTVDAVSLATEVYAKKFTPVKTDKKVLAKLKEQLSIYSETEKAEEFSEILELLTRRVDNYLAADNPVILAENL